MQVETRVYCPLSQMQTFWYRRLLLKDSTLLKKIEADFQAEGGKVLVSSNFRSCSVKPSNSLLSDSMGERVT